MATTAPLPRTGDVLMMIYCGDPHAKIPPYYLFDDDTGDVLAGPFERVEDATFAARVMARERSGQPWHQCTETTPDGSKRIVRYPLT